MYNTNSYANIYNERVTLYGAVINYDFNDNFYTELGFYAREGTDNGSVNKEQQIYTAGLGYKLGNTLSIYGEYQKADKTLAEIGSGTLSNYSDDGWAATLRYKGAQPADRGSWGLYATYYDQSAAVILDSVSEAEDYFPYPNGMKGYEVGIGYTLAKNIVANVSYYDLDNKDESYDDGVKLLWSTVTFSF